MSESYFRVRAFSVLRTRLSLSLEQAAMNQDLIIRPMIGLLK